MSTDYLINLLDHWTSKRVVVVGDFMLDRYFYGDAERLSPDAPVPVLSVRREEPMPGGAANVCRDLIALQCEVAAIGVVGQDAAGRTLTEALEKEGIDTAGLVADKDRPTTVKQNYVGLAQHRHPQKMFRVDIERTDGMGPATEAKLIESAAGLLPGADVLCLEDYQKGLLSESVCQTLIGLAKKHGVPVLVDPGAIEDYRKYYGATCLTPNRTEAEQATAGLRLDNAGDAQAMAEALVAQLDLQALVLTLDKHGALVAERDGGSRLIATRARSVYDVTGAGDIVLAMLAAATANGADWVDAVELANTAAGLEVEKFGVVPIALEQVLLALLERNHAKLGKVRTLDQLLPELNAYRKQGATIAFTNGCFDILHAGHVAYLREARKAGDLLVVGVNSDDSIGRIKGDGRPLNHEADRLLVLSELESVDYIVVFDEDTPRTLIEAIKPEALVKGADYSHDQVVGHEIVEAHGGRVVLIPLVEGRSTTNLIRKARNG